MLDRLMGDATYRHSVAASAQAHAERQFGVDRCAHALDAVYTQVMAANGTAPRVPRVSVDYGEDPRGFLAAGDLSDQTDPSFSVISRRPAFGAMGHLLHSIAGPELAVAATGAEALAILPLLLARGSRAIAALPPDPEHPLVEMIRLNRWTDNVSHSTQPLEEIEADRSLFRLVVASAQLADAEVNSLSRLADSPQTFLVVRHNEANRKVVELLLTSASGSGRSTYSVGGWLVMSSSDIPPLRRYIYLGRRHAAGDWVTAAHRRIRGRARRARGVLVANGRLLVRRGDH